MRAARYLYYRVFKYYSKGGSVPFTSTFIHLIALAYCNFLSLFDLIAPLLIQDRIHLPESRWWSLVVLIPGYLILNYVVKQQGYHQLILNEFKEETERERRIGIALVISYFVFSIALFVTTLWLREKLYGY